MIPEDCDLDRSVFPLSRWNTLALGTGASESFTDFEHAKASAEGSQAHREEQFQMLLMNDDVHSMRNLSGVLKAILAWENDKGPTTLIDFFERFVNTSWQIQARRVRNCCDKRRLGVLDNGMIGLVPVPAEPSDLVFLLPGASEPFLFRERGADCLFVGECFVQGVMYGEAWQGASVDALHTLSIV